MHPTHKSVPNPNHNPLWSSCASLFEIQVFAFGSASCGQLGNGETDGSVGASVYLPVPVRALEGHAVARATGGKNFSVFLTAAGELYSVGYASGGQLGIRRRPARDRSSRRHFLARCEALE